MGDVISTHLDESRRQYIAECTRRVLRDFSKFYEEQYGVALFNNVRYEIEGNGGPQSQLLHRKGPQEEQRIIFSGHIFQYLEDNKKWRNRFCLVPHYYGVVLYENKIAYDRGLQPRAGLNCAGYKVLKSMDVYMELVNSNSLPGGKAKSGGVQMKCATQFPIILWHPYGRHYHFCVMTEKEQEKWAAVFQDCVRHCNDGIPEDSKVEAPAFTDAVRLYRQSKDQYGTWELLCGNEVQVLSNLVMEELVPELKNMIGPRLKGKPHERQRIWLLISDTVYRMVQDQAKAHHGASAKRCEAARPAQEASIRTDMDQIITSKEHLASKIRASVLPKAEICVRNHIQPYIPSILEALMLPTSQGFSEVRDLFFKEVTEMNMNVVNEGGTEKLGEHMEKLSQLAFHPVKMQVCYDKMEQLKLEGLQQRFDVSSTSVFKQRAQIHMREQMDNAVFTFEQLLHQELEKTTDKEEVCRTMQRILERVLKKYDYDSSTVRKKFFREALLQIIMPFLLKKLAPTCKADLPRFQELIFEDFARSILVENTYEEVVLQSVMKEIMQAVKEAAVQRKHNLFRDSIVLHNSDPNLHLLGEGQPIDWSEEYGGEGDSKKAAPIEKPRRLRQVVSLIHDDESPLQYESCAEVPAHENIQEEPEPEAEQAEVQQVHAAPEPPQSPDYVKGIRSMLVKEFDVEAPIQAGDKTDAPSMNNSKVEECERSERPVGEEPTCEAPTHEEPASEAPEHKEPAYEAPTHPEPSCEAPTHEEPTREADARKESAHDAPTERETTTQNVSPEKHIQMPFREQEPPHEATDEETVNEEPSRLYLPHSAQHDSGFQSPSNEGENVEKSVMPDSPVKPSSGGSILSSDLEVHREDHQTNHDPIREDNSTTVHAMLAKADHVQPFKETLVNEEGLTKF